MIYKRAETLEEINKSNELMYITLFKPLGFKNSVKEELKMEGE